MSTLDNVFHEIFDIKTLSRAHKSVMRGKRNKSSATKMHYDFMSYLNHLQRQILHGNYQPQKYREFTIWEPKQRVIQAPHFYDQIVHQAIYSVLGPYYERHFFPTSYACRPKFGTHKAKDDVQKLVRNNSQLYACSIDISKYFATINHQELKLILAKNIKDKKLLRILDKIIDSIDSGERYDYLFHPNSPVLNNGRKGIPIGNLTSQLFANIYLHQADNYAKRHLKIRKYYRYMDDILFFHENKHQLSIWLLELIAFLNNELHLEANPRKIRIYPVHHGVDFVGYVMFPKYTRVRGSTVKRFKKRYRRQIKRVGSGKLSKEQLDVSFKSFVAHASHANGENLIANLEKWSTEKLS